MKRYVLRKKGQKNPIKEYKTRQEAVIAMYGVIADNKSHHINCDPFDFTLEEIECKEINEIVKSYEDARDYLGMKKPQSNDYWNYVSNDVACLVRDINPRHIKALIALNKLFTIAEAWNKADNFVPDFSNANQYKYYPWFDYDNDAAKFVFLNTGGAATYAYADFGSRLCFKTEERARQFGNMFSNLYNQVFL